MDFALLQLGDGPPGVGERLLGVLLGLLVGAWHCSPEAGSSRSRWGTTTPF